MLRLAVPAGAILLAAAVCLLLAPARPRPPAASTSAEGAVSRAELDDFHDEVARLRRQVAARPALVAPPPPAAAAPGQRSSDRDGARAALADLRARVAAQLARERPDPAWSAEAASRLARELGEAGLAPALTDVACAASMCKVELELRDPELREELLERVSELPSLRTQVLYDHHEGPPATVSLYVARTDRPLPLSEPR